ncbi:hypothetical protein [uncultured Albimonas sp.]|uniref:hypothetical protein n=1 Tax=uncultured Albimonas sp. TaxID=1331701 RepID=UPI0030EC5D23|tara:strand:+ start:8693 stop:9517 length:825 start_codon:yes stop_codon:yes gene_type:complete
MTGRFAFPPRRGLAVCAALFAASMLPAPDALAGAWTLPEGDGQAILGLVVNNADRTFDGSGTVIGGGGLDRIEVTGFVEYGLRDDLTLIGQTTLTSRETAPPFASDYQGLDYTELGLRQRLAQGERWVISGQGSVRLPGATDSRDPAQAGITDVETDLRLLLGRSGKAAGLPAFAELQTGYRVRFDDPPNEIRVDASFGVRPHDDWLLLGQSFTTLSDGSARGVFPDSDYVKLQASVVYDVTEAWSVQVGAFATVWGRNALVERAALAAVWRRF